MNDVNMINKVCAKIYQTAKLWFEKHQRAEYTVYTVYYRERMSKKKEGL